MIWSHHADLTVAASCDFRSKFVLLKYFFDFFANDEEITTMNYRTKRY